MGRGSVRLAGIVAVESGRAAPCSRGGCDNWLLLRWGCTRRLRSAALVIRGVGQDVVVNAVLLARLQQYKR